MGPAWATSVLHNLSWVLCAGKQSRILWEGKKTFKSMLIFHTKVNKRSYSTNDCVWACVVYFYYRSLWCALDLFHLISWNHSKTSQASLKAVCPFIHPPRWFSLRFVEPVAATFSPTRSLPNTDNRQCLRLLVRKQRVKEAGSIRRLLVTCCTDGFHSSGTRSVFLLEEFLDGASIPLRDHVGPQLQKVWPHTQLLQQGVSVHPAGGREVATSLTYQ